LGFGGGLGWGLAVALCAVDDEPLRRVDPAAIIGEMSEDANGLKDGAGSDGDAFGGFDDVPERKAEIMAAAGVESEGMRVAIDSAIGKAVEAGDIADAAPVQEFLLDLAALQVMANGTLALVAGRGRWGRGV
jgi:hypothetical protein